MLSFSVLRPAWYGITKKQLDQIEKIDLIFFKNLFNSRNNVAKEIYYMESGKLPTKFVLLSRRLSFLRHIMNSDKNGLLFKFYKIQKDCPVKNDWVLQVQRDREEIDLGLTDSDFTTLSKWQVYAAAMKHLNNIAKDHSKSYP